MATVNLSFEYTSNGTTRVRTATVVIPFDWDTPENLGTAELVFPLGVPSPGFPRPGGDFPVDLPGLPPRVDRVVGGHPLVIAMGGATGDQFIDELGLLPLDQERDPLLSRHTRWAQAIVIYPDPISHDGGVPWTVDGVLKDPDIGNFKYNSGNVGEGSWMEDVDDVGFLLELMHRVRIMLRDRMVPRILAGVEGYTALTRVINPDEIYMVGYSGGAGMCYRMAYEAPLVHPDDPEYEYRFAAMFVVAGSVGGFRHFREIGYPTLRVDFSPAVFGDEPATLTRSYPAAGSATNPYIRIMHFQGAMDNTYPSQWGEFDPIVALKYYEADATTNSAGAPRGGAFVVTSINSLNNYTGPGAYSEAKAEEFARADYTVEYGLDRWLRYKGLAGLPATPVVGASQGGMVPAISGTLMEALPDTLAWPPMAAELTYGLTGQRLLATFQGVLAPSAEVVFLLVAGQKHAWPGDIDIKSLILDFFDRVYP